MHRAARILRGPTGWNSTDATAGVRADPADRSRWGYYSRVRVKAPVPPNGENVAGLVASSTVHLPFLGLTRLTL